MESNNAEAAGTAAVKNGKGGVQPRTLKLFLSTVALLGLVVYAVCLFKHISYPLMWADESMTAVGAERVLQYGYPKVHDGRNIFYDLRHDDKTLGIDKKTDAYIGGAGWGHYYFAAPFALLAKGVSDIYAKTAILRIPFAAMGLLGLLLMLWAGTRAMVNSTERLAVAALFVLLELPSVTLMLHLREVRYYSLQLFLTVTAVAVFAAYHLYGTLRFRGYAALMVCLLPALFLTFSPACVALCGAIFLYLAGGWAASLLQEGRGGGEIFRRHLKAFSPVLGALLLIVPQMVFFKTLYISRKLEEFYSFTFSSYLEHLGVAWGYFMRYEVLAAAVVAKLILLVLWRRVRSDGALLPAVRLSLLLSAYFVIHTLLVAKIPNNVYVRYFVTLQPMLVMSFLLDLWVLWRVGPSLKEGAGKTCAAAAALLLVIGGGWAYAGNAKMISGRLYEISHQYKGVLDFDIPYIKAQYEHPERLVIATNYEEMSFVYYLNCRAIIGFLSLNMGRDLFERPDCVIFRSYWTNATDKAPYDYLLARDSYEAVRFPVYDYGFNNTPESAHWTPTMEWERTLHMYKTWLTDVPEYQAVLYLRKGSLAQQSAGQ